MLDDYDSVKRSSGGFDPRWIIYPIVLASLLYPPTILNNDELIGGLNGPCCRSFLEYAVEKDINK